MAARQHSPPFLLLQARQLYGVWLPTSPAPINVKCRLCGAFTGKDMVYDRQRYALNDKLERQVPPDLDVHLILDNYSSHKSEAVQRWLKPKKRKRFHLHFTPTSSSWLNQVERWFGLITERMIRRGTFLSVQELEQSIYEWLAKWNHAPKLFIWKATADVILDKVRRCKELSRTPH